MPKRFPRAIDPKKVGRYPGLAKSGGGYVWDAVLEYRVWCCPIAGAPDEEDGSDYYYAFSNYPDALRFSRNRKGADAPLALILQREHINEPQPGVYEHIKRRRITEWQVEWLARSRRDKNTIPDFFSPSAPKNRLDILRGLAPQPSKMERWLRRDVVPALDAIRADPKRAKTLAEVRESLATARRRKKASKRK